MYAPPHPLSQDRRAFTPVSSGARTVDIDMIDTSVSQNSASSRPETRPSPRESEPGTRAKRRSFFRPPPVRMVVVFACLALALPYVLAYTPPVQSASIAGAAGGTPPEMGYLVDAAVAAVDPVATNDPLHVVQSSFDPILVERVDLAAPATAAGMSVGTAEAPVVTAEMLRILAQMTPEQIDALTFLLLSQQDPKGAAAASDQASALADEAPWVGDWSAGDLDPDQANPDVAAIPVQNELLKGWYVFEASADEAVIRNIDDPLSAVRVSPGTVLGSLGLVSAIRIEADQAKVILSNGDVIVSDVSAKIILPEPEPSEPRRGPPFELALAKADAALQASSSSALSTSDGTVGLAAADSLAANVAVDTTPAPSLVPEAPSQQNAEVAGLYVQVATFRSIGNAQIARDIVVSDGMTGQLRNTTVKGASYHRVLAGPFSEAELQTALTRVGRLGFRDAFIIQ